MGKAVCRLMSGLRVNAMGAQGTESKVPAALSQPLPNRLDS